MRHPEAHHATDRLTGLLDRGGCIAVLSSLLDSTRAANLPLTVLWLDIDRFKQVNDSFGHLIGDSVLTELARRLTRTLPPQGRLARMGGDEFVVTLPDCDLTAAEAIASNLLTAIATPLGVGTVRLRPAASIGIAQAGPEETHHELLERTDRAMIDAKRLGGAQYRFAVDPWQPAQRGKHLAREELAVEECLHQAIEAGGLFLQYQPIVRVADQGIEAVEALMRCYYNGNTVSPGRFIPVAEKTGLIVHMGEWSLLTATLFLNRLASQGCPTKIAVNVSRAQLIAPQFTEALHAVLACTNVSPELIELEITESLFMDTSDVVQNNLRAAMESGFPLALDDFGTGYSSLACLKDLPADKLKLDRAFVLDLPHDKRSFAVVKAVTRLALDLGITVVAEGVETQEQYDALCEAGVTAIQGFLLARPMDGQDLAVWLSERSSP